MASDEVNSEQAVCTMREAVRRFNLDPHATVRVRRRLRGKRVGEVGGRRLYRAADVAAAVAADQARQWLHDSHENWLRRPGASKRCSLCGAPIPRRWIVNRCHACCAERAPSRYQQGRRKRREG